MTYIPTNLEHFEHSVSIIIIYFKIIKMNNNSKIKNVTVIVM